MTINKLHEWAVKWGMSFNKDKCKVMHVGHNNPQYDYFMQGTKLSVIEEEKDVAVIIHNSLKPARQCQKAAACGYSVLQQLRKNFQGQACIRQPVQAVCPPPPGIRHPSLVTLAKRSQAGPRKCSTKICENDSRPAARDLRIKMQRARPGNTRGEKKGSRFGPGLHNDQR
jgi:hypothetical protein